MVRGRRLPSARLCWALLATTAIAGGSSTASAQALQASDALILEPVTVTATTNPMAAFEYPGQVTVMPREQIELLNPSSLDDIYQFIPGVQSVGGPRRTGEVPSIRGFDGPDVNVLFDGVRQNFNSGHDGRLFLDPALLSSVEVVRGPTSALYGSGGLGGTLEFRTLDASDFLAPGETMGARGRVGYASVAGEDQYSGTTYGRSHGFDVLGSFSYRDAGDIELGDGSTLRNNESLKSGLVKGSYTGLPDHRFDLSYLGYRGDVTEPANPQGAGSGGLSDKNINNDTVRGAWRWTSSDHKWLDLGVLTYYVRNSVDETSLADTAENPAGTKLDRQVDTVGIKVDNRTPVALTENIHTLITYGTEAFRDKQDGSSSSSDDGERLGVPDADADTYAGFVQNEITFEQLFGTPGSWLLVPGLRYDHFKNDADGEPSNSDGKLSPKVGLSYLPTDWLMLFGNYAHAFRAPTFDEMYADGLHFAIPGLADNFFIPNPDLKPQETVNYELGAGLRFRDVVQNGDRASLKGSYFWIDGKDFIDLQVDQPFPPACFPPFCNGTTQAVNVHDAELNGTEIEADYDSRRLFLALGYSYLDGEDSDTGRPLGVQQPKTLTARVGLKFPAIDSIIGWRGIFAGRLDKADPGEEQDAYQVHDVFASWQPQAGLLRGLRFDAGVDNIFDKTYTQVYADVVEPGRDYKVALSYTLNW